MLIEISALCNLNCKHCFRKYRTGKLGNMSLQLFKHILEVDLNKFVFLGGAGEPFVNSNFLEMIDILKEDKRFISLNTNGTFLTDSYVDKNLDTLRKIDRLELSFDSNLNKELRTKSPLSLLHVLKNAEEKNLNIGRAVLLSEDNWKELELICESCRLLKVKPSFIFITPHYHNDYNNFEKWKFCIIRNFDFMSILTKYKYNDVLIDTGGSFCTQIPFYHNEISYLWNGVVVPCCYRIDEKYKIGDITKQTYKDIITGKELNLVREGKHPMCEICRDMSLFRKNPSIFINSRKETQFSK